MGAFGFTDNTTDYGGGFGGGADEYGGGGFSEGTSDYGGDISGGGGPSVNYGDGASEEYNPYGPPGTVMGSTYSQASQPIFDSSAGGRGAGGGGGFSGGGNPATGYLGTGGFGGGQQWAPPPPVQSGGIRGGPGSSMMGGVQSGGGYGGSPTISTSQSSTQMIPGMKDIYNQLLGINQNRYQNVMDEYQGAKGNMAATLPGIYQGYGDLSGGVMNTLGMGAALGQNGNWGVADPAAKAIGDTFAQQRGATTQQMTNAGLGNTTAVGNMQNQNAQQASRAYGALGAQLADKAAGYQSQIGQAGLGARMQGLGMQTNFTGGALGNLGQQASNTAGTLTGGQSNSYSGPAGGAGSGGGGGGGGAGGGWAAHYGVGNVVSSGGLNASGVNDVMAHAPPGASHFAVPGTQVMMANGTARTVGANEHWTDDYGNPVAGAAYNPGAGGSSSPGRMLNPGG